MEQAVLVGRLRVRVAQEAAQRQRGEREPEHAAAERERALDHRPARDGAAVTGVGQVREDGRLVQLLRPAVVPLLHRDLVRDEPPGVDQHADAHGEDR
jgi:hypothetical protein